MKPARSKAGDIGAKFIRKWLICLHLGKVCKFGFDAADIADLAEAEQFVDMRATGVFSSAAEPRGIGPRAASA